MSARDLMVWLLIVAFGLTAAGFLVAVAGDQVQPLPASTPTTYGYPR